MFRFSLLILTLFLLSSVAFYADGRQSLPKKTKGYKVEMPEMIIKDYAFMNGIAELLKSTDHIVTDVGAEFIISDSCSYDMSVKTLNTNGSVLHSHQSSNIPSEADIHFSRYIYNLLYFQQDIIPSFHIYVSKKGTYRSYNDTTPYINKKTNKLSF